jgi:hypothetical protein
VAHDDLIRAVQNLNSEELRALIDQRESEDKALKIILRAALARERSERRKKEVPHAS